MLLSLFISSIESTLMTLEATNVIVMRLQMIAKGDPQAQREADLMVSEKMQAFTQAGFDIAAGASNSMIRDNFRAVIRANEVRLNALRRAA